MASKTLMPEARFEKVSHSQLLHPEKAALLVTGKCFLILGPVLGAVVLRLVSRHRLGLRPRLCTLSLPHFSRPHHLASCS